MLEYVHDMVVKIQQNRWNILEMYSQEMQKNDNENNSCRQNKYKIIRAET